MKVKRAYIDIEATYTGDCDPNDGSALFKDFENWKFCAEKDYDGKKVLYEGIIGMLILDMEFDKHRNVYKLIDKKFVQLIGREITKDRLMKELEGVNEIVGYHCRTKPNAKGYIGYDYGVIGAQLGVVLDRLPGVRSIDLELYCHRAGIYGGLKKVESVIPTVPQRKSGIADGFEEEKVLLEIAACDDEDKKQKLWQRAKRYNMEDVINLVYIDQYIRNMRIVE